MPTLLRRQVILELFQSPKSMRDLVLVFFLHLGVPTSRRKQHESVPQPQCADKDDHELGNSRQPLSLFGLETTVPTESPRSSWLYDPTIRLALE